MLMPQTGTYYMFSGEIRKGVECNMQKKRLAAVAVAICAFAAGCADSMQTQEELVTPKETAASQITQETASQTAAQSAAIGETVAQQVQAPPRYQCEVSSETVHVTADAEVVIPDVKGIKTKKVTPRAFTQEDYDAVNLALLAGRSLWDRDYKAMEQSHGFTASELEEKASALEAEKTIHGLNGNAPYGGKSETLNEQIAKFRELAKTAPKEPVIVEVPDTVVYEGYTADGDGNWLHGMVTADGEDYVVSLDNSQFEGEAQCEVRFSVENDKYRCSWEQKPFTDLTQLDQNPELASSKEAEAIRKMSLQPVEIQNKAKSVGEKISKDDYAVQGGAYFAAYAGDESGEVSLNGVAYGVHLIRLVDGIPIFYKRGDMDDVEDSVWWQNEKLSLIYTDEGLAQFEWINPYAIEDLSAEYVFLLPFEDIRDVFEKMILKKQQDFFDGQGKQVEICVESVKLGYARVREAGADVEGTLVPVWDFYGSKTYRNDAGEVSFVNRFDFDSLMTINAMDGTIVE